MAMRSTEAAAFERLLTKAADQTGQSRFIRQFVLAWWNAPRWGGFDLAMLSSLDQGIADDMLAVMSALVRSTPFQPPEQYRVQIESLIRIVELETADA